MGISLSQKNKNKKIGGIITYPLSLAGLAKEEDLYARYEPFKIYIGKKKKPYSSVAFTRKNFIICYSPMVIVMTTKSRKYKE